ncbi:MAG: mechanosensitive ion channel family protein [Bdellovibrionales bacterium]|nr:mechanosensitive ion channel family protein [Bdellovibrionales bacterium]
MAESNGFEALNKLISEANEKEIPSLVKSYLPSWGQEQVFLLHNWQWVALFGAIVGGIILRFFVKKGVDLLEVFARRTKNEWDDRILKEIDTPVGTLAAIGFWYICGHLIGFEGILLKVVTFGLQIGLSLTLIVIAYRISEVAMDMLQLWASKTRSNLDDQFVALFRKTTRVLVWIFGILIALQNLGVNVMSLVAGLGLGGLAFALAAKDTAANFFGSIMILLDRPFRIGDWIVTNGVEGKVLEVGFRSTRIRTFADSVVSIPNSALMNVNIDNLGLRTGRRITATFGVTYDTPPEKLEAFMEGIKQIILAQPHTNKKDFHVAFNNYGNSSLDIVVYCLSMLPDLGSELMTRQNIFLEVLKLAKDLEISFAFPTQTLHIDSDPEHPLPAQNISSVEKLKDLGAQYGPSGNKSQPKGLGIFEPPYN